MAPRETLRSILESGRTQKRLDELSAARLVGKTAEQVHATQQRAGAGKAIGPITPQSIVIAASGETKLELANRGSGLAYTAPEVASGAAGDRRSDVFSLGVVLWEALTHQRLFDAMNDAAVKAALAEREIKSPAELNANVPAELAAIAMKALARTPTDRYGSAKAMGVEIEEFLSEAGYADNDEKIVAYLGELATAAPAANPAPVAAPPAPAPAERPVSGTLPPIEKVAAYAPPVAAAISAPAAPSVLGAAPAMPAPPVLPDSPKATLLGMPPAAGSPRDTVPDGPLPPSVPEPVASTGSTPHPASVVSLPSSRDSQRGDVLAGWGWGTDAHEAIGEDDALDFAPPSNRKPLLYVIGGGLGVAAIVTIIAVGFGGSKTDAKKPAPQASATEGARPAAPAAAAAGMGSADRAMAAVGSADVTGGSPATPGSADIAAGSGSADATTPGPSAPPTPEPQVATTEPPKAEPPKAEPPKAEPPKAEPPKPEPPKPEPPKPSKTEPVKVAKAEPPKPAKTEPVKVAKAEPPKSTKTEPTKPAKTEAAKTSKPPSKGTLADPFAAGKKPDKTAKASDSPKVDVETAYHVGLQQFARGDTNGALASLRTSLASNPNYPPTWRGLGLVFEKLGEKDQARAAFKRYLQLAPSAGDADSIRGRLERLGS